MKYHFKYILLSISILFSSQNMAVSVNDAIKNASITLGEY